MSRIQTLFAGIVLFIVLMIGTYTAFQRPVPYAYDNLSSQLNRKMKTNGMGWARIEVVGDHIYLHGTAPGPKAVFEAKALIQEQAGVTANFQGVKVKSVNTKDDTEPEDRWEKFKEENPVGRYQLNNAQNSSRTQKSSSTGAKGQNQQSAFSGAADLSAPDININQLLVAYEPIKDNCETDPAPVRKFSVLFRDHTAAIVADSLNWLDLLAQYNRSCTSHISIAQANDDMEQGLKLRRIDEIRYHLMAAGVQAENITSEQ